MSNNEVLPPLSTQAVGYGIIVGIGALFAIGIIVATKVSSKYLHEDANSTENFMVANRTVGVGLMASSVFSSWMWATEYLWAAGMVYFYGISVSFWYSAGLVVQIAVMSVLGIEAKKKIPNGHTSLEIIYIRYGAVTHLLYLFLCLTNNICAAAMIILGSGSAISSMTGVHMVACCFLLPFGVLLYTFVGGLRGTFYTDYVHTFVALILVMYFIFGTLRSEQIGSLGNLYDKVRAYDASGIRPVEGNYQGSYLTFRSKNGVFFAWLNSLGNFGLTIMDSSYWQKAFSSGFKSTVPGYILGSLAIFAIPFSIGSILGMANIVLESSKEFPTYPRTMTTYEANSGYGLGYTLYATLGKNSQAALTLAYFLATTSTISSELIAVSSLLSFDVYKRYINPEAKNSKLILVSHISVVLFSFFASGFTVMLYYVGVDMTWFGYFSTILITPGMFGLALSILWSKHSKAAAIVGPISGMVCGLVIWVVTAKTIYGEATITTLGYQVPNLYGSVASTFLPGVVAIILSYLVPSEVFDWDVLRKVELVKDEDVTTSSDSIELTKSGGSGKEEIVITTDERELSQHTSGDIAEYEGEVVDQVQLADENSVYLKKITKVSWIYFIVSCLVLWVLFPMPLYRNYIFSKAFYTGWAVVSIIWLLFAFFAVSLYPLYDGRRTLLKVWRGVTGNQ